MGLEIIKNGKVVHSDNKPEPTEIEKLNKLIEQQQILIQHLNNQIRDLKCQIK
jgi:hypothetical protein